MDSSNSSIVKDFELNVNRFLPKFIADAENSRSNLYLQQANEFYEKKQLFPLIHSAISYANLTICYGGKCDKEILTLCRKIWQLLDVRNNTKINEKTAGFNCLSTLVSAMLDSIDHYWLQDGKNEFEKLAKSLDFIKMDDLICLFDDYFKRTTCKIPKNGVSSRQSYLQSAIILASTMRKVWTFDTTSGDLLIKYITENLDFYSNKIYYYFRLLLVLAPAATLHNAAHSGLIFKWWDESDSIALNHTFITLLERAAKYQALVPCADDSSIFKPQFFISHLYQLLFNYLRWGKASKKGADELRDVIPSEYAGLCDKSPSAIRKLTKIIVYTRSFERLPHLIDVIEPYTHPSNNGVWSLPISNFFQTLFSTLMKLDIRSYIVKGASVVCGCDMKYVFDTTYNIVFYGMMSKNNQISSNYFDVLKRICYLDPSYLSKAVDKLLFMMDIVEEPQSSIVAMRALSQLTPLIIKFCPSYIPTLIDKSISLIVPSDPLKSSQALFLITMQGYNLGLIDMSSDFISNTGNNKGLNQAFNRLLEFKMERFNMEGLDSGAAIGQEIDFKLSERCLFNMFISWGETAQFPQKMALIDQGVITIIKTALIKLFKNTSELEWMGEKFLEFEVTRDNLHFANSMGLAFAVSNASVAMKIFERISSRVLKRLSNSDSDISPQISLLSSLIRCVPESFKFSPQVASILEKCWLCRHKTMFKCAAKLAQRCLESVLNVYPTGFKGRAGEFTIQWHVPEKSAIDATAPIVQAGLDKINCTVFGDKIDLAKLSLRENSSCSGGDENSLNKVDYVNRAYAFLIRLLKAGLLSKEPEFTLHHPLAGNARQMIDKLINDDISHLSSTHAKLSKLLGELVSQGACPLQFGVFTDVNSSIMNCVKATSGQKSNFFSTSSLKPFMYNAPLILLSSNLIDSLSIFSRVTKKSHFFGMPVGALFGLTVQRVSEILNHYKWPVQENKFTDTHHLYGYVKKMMDIAILGDEAVAGKAKSHLLSSMVTIRGAKSVVLEYVLNKSLEIEGLAQSGDVSYDQAVINTIKFLVPPLLRRVLCKPKLLKFLFKFLVTAAGSGDKCGRNKLTDNTRNALAILVVKAVSEKVELEIIPEEYLFSSASIINACLLSWVKYDERLKNWLINCMKSSLDLSLREILQSQMITHNITIGDLPFAVGLCKSISSRRHKVASAGDNVGACKNSPYLKLVKALKVEPVWVPFRFNRMGSGLSLKNITFLKSVVNHSNAHQALEQLEYLTRLTGEPEANITFIELLVAMFDKIDPPAAKKISILVNSFIKNCKIEYMQDLADAITLTNNLGGSAKLWIDLLGDVKYSASSQSLEFYRKLVLLTMLALNNVDCPYFDKLDTAVYSSECLQIREQFATLLVVLIKANKQVCGIAGLDPSCRDGLLRFGIRLFTCKKWKVFKSIDKQFLDLYVATAFDCLASGKEDLKLVAREAIIGISEIEFNLHCGDFNATALACVCDLLLARFVRSLDESSPQSSELALDGLREFWLKTQFLQEAKPTIDKLAPLVEKVPPHLYVSFTHLLSTMTILAAIPQTGHFLYLSSLVYSFPYSMREWTPRVLTDLSLAANESESGGSSGTRRFIESVLQDFFKTHIDGWNEWRDLFTREQLDIVDMNRGRPCYFL